MFESNFWRLRLIFMDREMVDDLEKKTSITIGLGA